MQIIEKTYDFGAMDKRKKTARIILHHAAKNNTAFIGIPWRPFSCCRLIAHGCTFSFSLSVP